MKPKIITQRPTCFRLCSECSFAGGVLVHRTEQVSREDNSQIGDAAPKGFAEGIDADEDFADIQNTMTVHSHEMQGSR